MNEEDRYEALDMIIKVRSDGQSWFDIIHDMITEECEGDPESEENTCTCGMESMGGTTGTLDQCYRHLGIADDIVGPVSKVDLLRVLSGFEPVVPEDQAAYDRLYKEATWWDETLTRWAEESDEESDEISPHEL